MSLEESLMKHCAPTLAGIKIASLYRFFPENPLQFAMQLKQWREWFALRGLHLSILQGRRRSSYLLYLYRPHALTCTLAQPEVKAFLVSCGYDMSGDCGRVLCQLAGRLTDRSEFPHEIGVFLGYPLEDVKGFIENNGKNFTCCGYWKSYGDPAQASRRFSSYRTCTELYARRFASGMGLAQSTVAG